MNGLSWAEEELKELVDLAGTKASTANSQVLPKVDIGNQFLQET